VLNDGDIPVQVPAEWTVAPADDDVRFICGQHKWRSACLVLNDGTAIYTTAAKMHSEVGLFASPGELLSLKPFLRVCPGMDHPQTGKAEGSGNNLIWQGDKAAAKHGYFDVLIRKRA
jgi:hypothetical protein